MPKGQPTLFIAQEFLDALPVHQFQYTENGWRERLVDVNVPGAGGASVDGPEGCDSQEGDGSAAEGGGGESRKQESKEADFR